MELGSTVQYTGCCLNSASGEQVGDPGGGSGGGRESSVIICTTKEVMINADNVFDDGNEPLPHLLRTLQRC